ncbi:MAG TPA: GNAT family N-acetyltransferase [Rhodocyclaceae bacterium]|nr:GNAT family N-acetyltransferase [Rhodocyclaceae bacterium]
MSRDVTATVRKVRSSELPRLLPLYRYLNPDDAELTITVELEQLWQSILANPQLHYLVAEVDERIVSTCALAIIPNLTRAARPYGLIENVVTDPAYRKRGIATHLLHTALDLAWAHDCYKVMLMTGRKDEATLRFYSQAGFVSGEKTGFVARPREPSI